MTVQALDADAIVVGAGPVGAGAALLLARQGLRVRILDKSPTVYELPRALLLDGETTRSFQRVGLGKDVEAMMHPWRETDAGTFANSRRETMFGMEIHEVGTHGWRDAAFFDQPEFDARLREWIEAEPLVETRYGHQVTDLGESGSAAWVEHTDLGSGQRHRSTARWILGCDGASSFVRRHLGIAWRNLGYDHEWLVVDVEVEDPSLLPSVCMQVCDPARLATFICGKDPYRRWEFRLLPGESREEMSRPETVQRLLDPWIARDRYRLRRAVVYQFHAATAERWQQGRIFLAGDSAHQTPPFLGQGLNAGFRDVANLGWKMPMVQRGLLPESVLDTYQPEREEHGRELVEWAVAVGRLMDAMADAEAGRAEGPPPDDLMRSGYGQGRTVPPLRRGIVVEEQVGDAGVTGYPLRQYFVAADGGGEVLLDEYLGPGFAVLARRAEDLACSAANRAWFESLGGRFVALDGLPVARGGMDRLFALHPVAVVRPDRYVFGVVDDAHSLDALLERLRSNLQGASGPTPQGEH